MGKVTSIGIDDSTGVKHNVTELLELLANGQLKSVVIAWGTEKGTEHVFWNGNSLETRGLAAQALADMTYTIASQLEYEKTYDESLGGEDDDERDVGSD